MSTASPAGFTTVPWYNGYEIPINYILPQSPSLIFVCDLSWCLLWLCSFSIEFAYTDASLPLSEPGPRVQQYMMPSDPPNPRSTNIVYPASSTLPENCCLDLANASQPDLGHCLCRSKQGTAGASQALEHISRSRSTMPHKFDGARKFGLDRIQKSVVRMVGRMSLVAKRLDHNLRCQCYE